MGKMLYLVFFLSGASGLIYQVSWVRQFGLLFGNTIYSAAVVTGIFMLGLGLGSYVVGRWIDKKFQLNPLAPLSSYAHFELAIGVIGGLLCIVLPNLEFLAASMSAYVVAENGWHELSASTYAFRYALAVALLFPATFLMGGTLPLLARFQIQKRLSGAGWAIGRLYGVNTAGAAIGALSVDFWLTPRFGVAATQSVAVVLNFAVALIALRLIGKIRPMENRPIGAVSPVGSDNSAVTYRRVLMLTCAALFLSGFAAMGMEIVWFRLFTSFLGQYRHVFSLLLAIILVGIFIGAMLGGYLCRRTKYPIMVYLWSQALLAASIVLGILAVSDIFVGVRDWLLPMGSQILVFAARDWIGELIVILVPVLIPSICMGVAYPAANAIAQNRIERVGQAAGQLYLFNTLGAVAGSLVSGFLLIPFLGMRVSFGSLLVVSLIAVIPLLCIPGKSLFGYGKTRLASIALALLLALTSIGYWQTVPDGTLLRMSLSGATIESRSSPGSRIISESEGVLETITIVESEDGTDRYLFTNGHNMSTTNKVSHRYMRAFAHIPLLMSENPTAALVICFGVGNTAHAVSLHPSIERLEVADLSKHVLKHADFFRSTNDAVLSKPITAVYVNDGRQHLRMQPANSFDLVTLEPPPIRFAGVSSLYSVEFYRLVEKSLKPDGFISQWLPVNQVSPEINLSIARSFLDVFPNAILLEATLENYILLGRKSDDVITVDPLQVLNAINSRPDVKQDLEFISMPGIVELVGTFLADAEVLNTITRDSNPITMDWPYMEYGSGFFAGPPRQFFALQGIDRWCPKCFDSDTAGDLSQDLTIFQRIRAAAYWLQYQPRDIANGDRLRTSDFGDDEEKVKAAIEKFPYLNTYLQMRYN